MPEPLLTSADVAEDVELAEGVSIAMLTVLETLAPTEPAVFVLRDLFDVPYDEIAVAVDRSPAAVRQVAHRARVHVAARRPRMRVDRCEQQQVVARFVAAVTAGDVQGLMGVLAPDVVLLADGEGIAEAVRVPVIGAKKVANLLRPFPEVSVNPAIGTIRLNGSVGLRIDDRVGGTTIVNVVVEDGQITRIFAMRNPHKLPPAGRGDHTHPLSNSPARPARRPLRGPPAEVADTQGAVPNRDRFRSCQLSGADGAPAIVLLHALGEQATSWE